MKWIVDGIEMDVELVGETDAVATFRIDGEETDVPFRRLTGGRVQFRMDGRSLVASVHFHGGERHVALDGATHVIQEARRSSSGDGSASGEASNAIYPPMPGVIVEVLVEAGDVIDKGQRLIVITAMKMETVIAAPRRGRIQEICVAAGDSVGPGDLLIALEEGEADG